MHCVILKMLDLAIKVLFSMQTILFLTSTGNDNKLMDAEVINVPSSELYSQRLNMTAELGSSRLFGKSIKLFL